MWAAGWVGLAWLALAPAPLGAQRQLPPLDGELEGRFTPLALPGAPTLAWKLTLRSEAAGARAIELTAEGEGARVRAALRLDADGNGTWRIVEANADLAKWIGPVAARLGGANAGWSGTGSLRAEGEGTWRDGRWEGAGKIGVRDATLEDPTRNIRIEGVATEFVVESIASLRSAPGQVVTWKSGNYDVTEFGAGRIVFSLAREQVQVDEAALAFWGGDVVLSAFAFSLQRPEVTVIARVLGIDMIHLLPALNYLLSDANGEMDGSVTLRYTTAGLEIVAGRLALRAGEEADLRLAPSPGLISSSLPPVALEQYPGLAKIETGEVPLRAKEVEIVFNPDGDAQGRAATMHIAGGPVDPRFTAPIDLTVNVRGPLAYLIEMVRRMENFRVQRDRGR